VEYIKQATNRTLQQQPSFHGHDTKLKDFVGAKFYCPHALADGNQHINIYKPSQAD